MNELVNALLIGGYVYTTGVFLWFQRKYERLRDNHIKHVEERLRRLEQCAGIESPTDEGF